MASIINYGEIVMAIINSHESFYLSIKAHLGSTTTKKANRAGATTRQVENLGCVPECVAKYTFQLLNLVGHVSMRVLVKSPSI
jgi:hypothetical protein